MNSVSPAVRWPPGDAFPADFHRTWPPLGQSNQAATRGPAEVRSRLVVRVGGRPCAPTATLAESTVIRPARAKNRLAHRQLAFANLRAGATFRRV